MSTIATPSGTPVERAAPAGRVVSIDIFRGFTMLVMIFVNDLAGVHGLPWWTYHAHAQQDLMTYVDMVFPFFLFIVGMSMPLAVARRLSRSPSILRLWLHVASRAVGLIVLGLILANADKCDPARMVLSPGAWALLGLTGAILFWLVPSRDPRYATAFRVLRIAGLCLLLLAFALFRRAGEDGHTAWIDGSYPEILGLIGATYFAVALLYIPTRRWLWAPLAWFVALSALCALATARIVHVSPDPKLLWPFGSGAMASITMAGVVTSTIFLGEHRWQTWRSRLALALGFAAAALIAARLLTPLGISKIRATPTWCLYSIGAAVLVFTLLYWICDVRGKSAWAAPVRAAGENALLTYLLPDIFYFVTAWVGFTYLDTHLHTGAAGVVRAVVFTLLMLAVSNLLTRWRVRLQL